MKYPGKPIKPAAAVLLIAAMASLSGCKDFFRAVNNNPGGGTSTYVYVANVGSGGSGGTISEYSLTTGTLASLSGSPISLNATPTSIAVAPNNKFLFVGTSLGVFLYTIGTNGALTQGNNNTIVYLGPSSTESIAVDPTSSWLIIANKASKELDALPIDPTTGVPTSNTPATAALSNATPQQITISPANNNIFVTLGANGTDAFGFAPSSSKAFGSSVHIPVLSGSGEATAVAVDTTSTYLFIAETTTNKLRLIAIANLAKDVADYSTGKDPSSILPDATGTYVYVANQTDNTVSGYSFSAGALTELAASPFATAKAPIGLIEDSSKTYLFSAGFGANPNLFEYTFDATVPGTLDVKTSTSTTSTSPSNSNGIAATH